MSFNNEQSECPICFDIIGEKNNIITECGHKFHASCLMTNVSLNGFSCPCCRSVMAESNDSETEYTEDDTDSENTDDETATLLDDHIPEPFSEYALLGLRLFTNLLEGNENENSDIEAESQYNIEEEEEEEEEEVPLPVPSHDFVVNALREQGITYEQLAAWILIEHDEYDSQIEELTRFSGNLWGNLRIIISNYNPQPETEVVPNVVEEVVPDVVEEVVPQVVEEVVPEAISPICFKVPACLKEEFILEDGRCFQYEIKKYTMDLCLFDVAEPKIQSLNYRSYTCTSYS
jgi:hypothetical protein